MTRMTAALRGGATALVLLLAVACTSTAATPQPHASPAPHNSPTTAPPPTAISPPVSQGTLRMAGPLRDGLPIRAAGLSWRPSPLPPGTRLLSFEVGYVWQACTTLSGGTGKHCSAAADATVTPFAARRYVTGHGDTGKYLKLTETAAEVVETDPATFTFRVVRSSRSYTAPHRVRRYPYALRPVTGFLNGLPERRTASNQEYFQVSQPHFNAANGPASQAYRVDGGPWRAMPRSGVFPTGKLAVGRHRVEVQTADVAGVTMLSFGWRVVPLPAPLPCTKPHGGGSCWYPPHLDRTGHPMRWDWQIGRVTPLQRAGQHAVDIYDIDGFLTTPAEIQRIHTAWQASTLAHPKAVCYLDLAWEDYRPDASPAPDGRFPAATLGKIYYGYPEERWVDFRQLDALKPMLNARIAMCASKGFDAVELDDIDSFDPPSTTGFHLTPGDAQNYLAYAFNQVHRNGMTALWKNSPLLAGWGARYTDGAVVEECYTYGGCPSWDVFTGDHTARQPTGKWVGEAEYGADHFVCDPGQACPHKRRFATFCARVYAPPGGFAAVKFDVDLDGKVFYPCPTGT